MGWTNQEILFLTILYGTLSDEYGDMPLTYKSLYHGHFLYRF
ncbi:hypothetical protein BQ1740_2420 [Bacillus subtilis]|nr:hypothetical protein BQ1740_2420 [Bacillus subtilis]